MAITSKQALDAMGHLHDAHNRALVVFHATDELVRTVHLREMESSLASAATALGYKLVKIEDNELHVVGEVG